MRAEIEETRSTLSRDVNVLADTVNPASAAKRKAASARAAVLGAKDKVMGATAQSASSTSSAVGDALSDSKEKLRGQASGNPLAVGLIAVGVGWLVGSLLPASAAERQVAVQVKESTMPLANQTAREVAGKLQDPAQQAVESVRSTAADAAAAVKDETISSAQEVKAQAQDAKDTVQDTRG
jgi:gas vesicle protein